MAKPYNICKVCGARKFLNFAGLCTKCNKNVAGLEIVEKALEKKHEMLESQAEMQAEMEAHQSEELKEKQALEEMDVLTSEQKERLVELSPGINTIAELNKEVKKIDEETKEEETKEEETKEEETKEEKPNEK
ncbi:MAG: hypothetical protein MIO93_03865 [ANME-2 cluster archaeon]|nr:hypothetical protein [ANME-2 cluster archaeon]